MKATIIEKGDGFVLIRCESVTTAEAIMLANVSMEGGADEKVGMSLHSNPSTYDNKIRTSLLIGSISLPVTENLAR